MTVWGCCWSNLSSFSSLSFCLLKPQIHLLLNRLQAEIGNSGKFLCQLCSAGGKEHRQSGLQCAHKPWPTSRPPLATCALLALPILALLLSLVGASHKSCYLSVLEQFLLLSQRWTLKVNKQWLNAIVSCHFLFGWKVHGTGDVQALSDPTTTRPSPPPSLRTCSDPTLPYEG